jgi:hypothetical protein
MKMNALPSKGYWCQDRHLFPSTLTCSTQTSRGGSHVPLWHVNHTNSSRKLVKSTKTRRICILGPHDSCLGPHPRTRSTIPNIYFFWRKPSLIFLGPKRQLYLKLAPLLTCFHEGLSAGPRRQVGVWLSDRQAPEKLFCASFLSPVKSEMRLCLKELEKCSLISWFKRIFLDFGK